MPLNTNQKQSKQGPATSRTIQFSWIRNTITQRKSSRPSSCCWSSSGFTPLGQLVIGSIKIIIRTSHNFPSRWHNEYYMYKRATNEKLFNQYTECNFFTKSDNPGCFGKYSTGSLETSTIFVFHAEPYKKCIIVCSLCVPVVKQIPF